MCSNCATGWGICACAGGDVFGKCACSSNISCPVCNHYPKGTTAEDYKGLDLGALLRPEILERERAAYEAKQGAQ